ncbi:hypothetical protein [Desulforegula conservatrix]|uniref:hypothetical protein n=1 Tax=Desulforegula conservatrix TaxID=153026 RepID=UPI0004196698|nr:hypothetical protein [Desulforegula conservatrix]
MPDPIKNIQDLVSFISELNKKAFKGRLLTSEMQLSQALYDNLLNLENKGFIKELKFDKKSVGGTASLKRQLERERQGTVQIVLELPRSKNLFYTNDLDDLISYQSFAWEKPEILILDALSYNGVSDPIPPDVVRAYYLVINLIALLSKPEAGNHSNRNSDGLDLYILGPNKKLQLDIKYSASDLNFIALDKAMSTFNSILNEKAYTETKYTLLRSCLIDFLMPVPQADRFSYLIKHITEAATQFRQNFELFLSEFKFENEREKIETVKREYILGINKVFDDIQNKILAIPASLILIGGQMNFAPQSDTKTLVSNWVIIIGSFIFSLIMVLMIRNQKNTLETIKKDYTIREKRIKYQLSNSQLYEDLNNAFSDIETRYRKQKKRLYLIDGMVACGQLLTIWLFSNTTACSYLIETITKKMIIF